MSDRIENYRELSNFTILISLCSLYLQKKSTAEQQFLRRTRFGSPSDIGLLSCHDFQKPQRTLREGFHILGLLILCFPVPLWAQTSLYITTTREMQIYPQASW